MLRLTTLMTLAAVCLFSSGCAMCCAPYDYDYNAFGGRWERHDMLYGRAGSAFAPASERGMAGGEGMFEGDVQPFEQGAEIAPEIIEEGGVRPYYEQIETPPVAGEAD